MKPMLPTDAPTSALPRYTADPAWALQEKLDGHHILLLVQERAVAYGRDGQVSQHRALFNDAAHTAAYSTLPGTVALDGELVDGVFWAFDLVAGNGRAFRKRWQLLEDLFATWEPPPNLFRLVETAFGHEDKAALALRCVREKAEGVIARRVDAPYLLGRSSGAVLKCKFVKEADLVVVGIGREGKDNAVLAAHVPGQAEPVEVGAASTHGKGEIAVGDVVTVRFQRFTPAGRLREPRIIRARTDKAAAECTMDQLRPIPAATR